MQILTSAQLQAASDAVPPHPFRAPQQHTSHIINFARTAATAPAPAPTPAPTPAPPPFPAPAPALGLGLGSTSASASAPAPAPAPLEIPVSFPFSLFLNALLNYYTAPLDGFCQ